ncbi:unnamed protein product, partial [Didymodactylos carnosus]
YSGFLKSVKLSFVGTFGDFDIDYFSETTYNYVSIPLLIIYIVVVAVLLLNLLIAMMGDTFKNVLGNAKQIWQLERARISYAIESDMSIEERQKAKYWTMINGRRYLEVEELITNY